MRRRGPCGAGESASMSREIRSPGENAPNYGLPRFLAPRPRLLRPCRGVSRRRRLRRSAAGGGCRIRPGGSLPRAAERPPPAPPPRRVRRHLRRGRARGGGRATTALRPVGGRGSGNGDVRVHLVVPKSFNDAQQIADKFKDSIPVILNLQSSDTDLSKRLIDFASGLTYALDGGMQRIADKVFMLTPRNVEISAEERARLIEKGFFNSELSRAWRRSSSGDCWSGSLKAPHADRSHRSRQHGAGACARVESPGARGRSRQRARAGAGRRGRRRGARDATPRWPNAPNWSCSATSRPSSRTSRAKWRRTPRRSPRSSPPRRWRICTTPIRTGPSTASFPRSRRGAPGRRRPGRSRARRHALDAQVGELFAELGTLVVLARRARRRGDGPDVLRPRLRGARRRGADRRGRAPRHPRRAERGAGRADARRDRGAAAPPRQRHARGAPRGHLPGRGHGRGPGRAGARRAARGLQRRPRRGPRARATSR